MNAIRFTDSTQQNLIASPSPPAMDDRLPQDARDWSAVKVGIVLFNGVQIIDFAAPYEVFGAAGFSVATISADGGSVTTAMGLKVAPDHAFADAPAFDVVVVPGGEVQEAMHDPALQTYLRAQPAQRTLMSICTGAHILASAGLLDNRRATTFHGEFDDFERTFPRVELVRDQRWVDSGRIVTAAGLASGIDASLFVVARYRGGLYAQSVALHLEYPWDPNGGFVRGRMIDRQAPRLDCVPWPEGTSLQSLYSVGDTSHWKARFLVVSPTASEELLKLIAAYIDSKTDWTREGEVCLWHRDINGQRKRLMFAAWPRDEEGTFFLSYEIE